MRAHPPACHHDTHLPPPPLSLTQHERRADRHPGSSNARPRHGPWEGAPKRVAVLPARRRCHTALNFASGREGGLSSPTSLSLSHPSPPSLLTHPPSPLPSPSQHPSQRLGTVPLQQRRYRTSPSLPPSRHPTLKPPPVGRQRHTAPQPQRPRCPSPRRGRVHDVCIRLPGPCQRGGVVARSQGVGQHSAGRRPVFAVQTREQHCSEPSHRRAVFGFDDVVSCHTITCRLKLVLILHAMPCHVDGRQPCCCLSLLQLARLRPASLRAGHAVSPVQGVAVGVETLRRGAWLGVL